MPSASPNAPGQVFMDKFEAFQKPSKQSRLRLKRLLLLLLLLKGRYGLRNAVFRRVTILIITLG
eukprot:1138650-Pelagomonas_calceolata.AAC.2